MSVAYLLFALRVVRWFCLTVGLAVLVVLFALISIDVIRDGLTLTHIILSALALFLFFWCYRSTEGLLLLSLNSTLRKLYLRGKTLQDEDLSQRLREEIARREKFHQLFCRLYGEESLAEILDHVCGPARTAEPTP